MDADPATGVFELRPRETEEPHEDWAWAREPGPTHSYPTDASDCVGILVVHNAEPWLARSLVALRGLEPRPRLVAVDNGSTDGSHGLLARAVDEGLLDRLETGPATGTVGTAVAAVEAGLEEHVEWLWLLHDDVEPKPDCLGALLAAAQPSTGEIPDLLLPKLLAPRRRNHADRVVELGQSVGPGGGRVLDIDDGEIDQQQLAPAPVLGGSTAGMLVSRRVWRQLGGLRPELPLHRDGVDLGWRANEAGLRVVTCPQAALHHRQVGRNGERRSDLDSRPERLDRLLGMRMVAAHSRHPGATTLRLVLASLLAALGFLLGKAPVRAADAFGAGLDLLRQRESIADLHQAVGSPAQDVDDLRPARGWLLRHRLDQAAGWVADRILPEREADTTIDELTTDAVGSGRRARSLLIPVTISLVLLAALVAGRRLFGFGQLTGPALSPAPKDLAGAWEAWLAPGVGQPAGAGWLGLGALGSTITLGQPGWFAVLAQLLSVPLAAFASVPLWRRLVPTAPRRQRLALALAAGLSQAGLGVTGLGSPGSLLVACTIPLAAAAWLDWFRGEVRGQQAEGAESLRAPARLAFWSALALMGLPSLYVALVIACGVVLWRHRGAAVVGGAIALLGPVLACLPWLLELGRGPARLLTGTDPLLLAGADAAATPWGAEPWWVFLVVALALWTTGATGAALEPAGRVVLAAALGAWVVGLLMPRLGMSLHGRTLHGGGQGWLLLAALLVLCAAAVPATRLLAGLLATLVVLQGLWWVTAAGAPVHRTRSELPASVVAVQHSSRQTRALLVDLSAEPARWSLVAADQPRWGSAEGPMLPDAAAARADRLVESIVSGRGSDGLAEDARALGVGHLWVRAGTAEQVSAVSDSPGLGPAEARGGAVTWTVTGLVSRTPEATWGQPRAWWRAVLPLGALAVLLVLAAPSSARTSSQREIVQHGPRRGV